jgi:hypothetical protein
VVPPPEPAQLQNHGPVPVTAEAVPTLQRFVFVGTLVTSPFAEPHWPLTAAVAAACGNSIDKIKLSSARPQSATYLSMITFPDDS